MVCGWRLDLLGLLSKSLGFRGIAGSTVQGSVTLEG